jgi:hypothetical protein
MGPLNSFYKKSCEYRLVSLALVFIFLITILQVPVANALWRDVLGVSGEVSIVPPPPPSGQSGTSISAEVNVNSVSEQNGEEDHLELNGQVCINNTGDAATRDLRVLLKLQFKPEKGKFQDLPNAFIELIPSEPLEPGASQCYDYQMGFSPLAGVENYRISAAVTITNHSGYLPGGNHCPGPALCPFGPEPKATFTIPCNSELSIEKVESTLEITPVTPTEPVIQETPLPAETGDPTLPTENAPLLTETVKPTLPTEEAPLPTEVVETSPPPQETEPPAATEEPTFPPVVTEEPAPPTEVTEELPPAPPPVE